MTIGMPSIMRYGPYAILLSWPGQIGVEMLSRIKTIDTLLDQAEIDGITGITPAYSSILITISSRKFDLPQLKKLLLAWQGIELEHNIKGVIHKIEVNYDQQSGLDLEAFAKAKKMSVEEVVSLHTATTYDVHFIGFLPGFLYLGGLHPALHLKRRATPRVSVPSGAVAIGGGQTGIYPSSSPGGWHIIGHTDHELFHLRDNPPIKISIGDKVKFIPHDGAV